MLSVLIIRDERPGHFNQSEGVLKAIQRVVAAKVDYVEISKAPVTGRRLIYSLYNRGMISDRRVLEWLYPAVKTLAAPDLIISAGGETLLLNVVLARNYKCRNIFSGSLRNIDPGFFSAVLIPYRQFSDVEPYICCLKPCAVDPDDQPLVKEPFDICLLVGGPSGTHTYTDDNWNKLLAIADAAAREFRVGIFASRRTPEEIFGRFVQRQSASLRVFGARDISSAGVIDFCKTARMIFVTEDSNSMITEAVCCRKPVGVLRPASNSMNSNETAYLEDLTARNWICSQALDKDFSLEMLFKQVESLQPMQENHLDVLAQKLRKKLRLVGI
jgi:mitochondrial fission protein ELM1